MIIHYCVNSRRIIKPIQTIHESHGLKCYIDLKKTLIISECLKTEI